MKEIYVYFNPNNEIIHAYTTLEPLFEICAEWYTKNCDNPLVCHDFFNWVEDRKYPNTEEGEQEAWNDYVEYKFNQGEWGDYYYLACELD